MEYYDDITDEELTEIMYEERKRKIKIIVICTIIFLLLLAFIIFSIVSYNYNPQGGDDIVVKNNF